ncbi:MAG TPA: response regulator, partial [Isosphaeraceae bacterium]|nr:response regulator [Isosphaeraceae bacterium]
LTRVFKQEVKVVHDGHSALETAPEFRPEMILLDIGMPGMDGYETARRLRERPECRQIRIVALTGWGQIRDRERTEEAGFDQHLVKPIAPGAIRDLIAWASTSAADRSSMS